MKFEFLGGPLDGELRELPDDTFIFDLGEPKPYDHPGVLYPSQSNKPFTFGRYQLQKKVVVAEPFEGAKVFVGRGIMEWKGEE